MRTHAQMPSVSTGADIQPQSPRPKRRVRKVTLSKGERVDRWRAGNEMETSKSMKRRGGRECGNNPKEQEKGGIRRIAFLLCSIKGEITHLLRFFLKTTAPIDQTAWMYRPIFNMKYRQQKSITPVFSPSLLLSAALTCSFSLVEASTSLSSLLPASIPASLRLPGYGSPHLLPLTPTLRYPPLHVPDKWRSRSYSIMI